MKSSAVTGLGGDKAIKRYRNKGNCFRTCWLTVTNAAPKSCARVTNSQSYVEIAELSAPEKRCSPLRVF